jgi:hypothetical protein
VEIGRPPDLAKANVRWPNRGGTLGNAGSDRQQIIAGQATRFEVATGGGNKGWVTKDDEIGSARERESERKEGRRRRGARVVINRKKEHK